MSADKLAIEKLQMVYKPELCCHFGATGFRLAYTKATYANGKVTQPVELVLHKTEPDLQLCSSRSVRLNWRSRLLLLTSAEPSWPPEYLVEMGCENGTVWFEYVDDPDEQPFGRKASRWRVSLRPNQLKWNLEHIGQLR